MEEREYEWFLTFYTANNNSLLPVVFFNVCFHDGRQQRACISRWNLSASALTLPLVRLFIQINFHGGKGHTWAWLRFAGRNCRYRNRWIFQRVHRRGAAASRTCAPAFSLSLPYVILTPFIPIAQSFSLSLIHSLILAFVSQYLSCNLASPPSLAAHAGNGRRICLFMRLFISSGN